MTQIVENTGTVAPAPRGSLETTVTVKLVKINPFSGNVELEVVGHEGTSKKLYAGDHMVITTTTQFMGGE